jgi:myosin heavy subunit
MGRAGVTLLDVEKAALQLLGRGKNPTVDAVRELLGTGSKSTIIQHLKTWKSKNDEAHGKLPQDLQALVTGLWERLNAQAEERIINVANSHAQEQQELRQALHQSQREHTELKNKYHQVEETLYTERQVKAELEKQLQLEQQEHAKLRERYHANTQHLEDHKAENLRLHQLAANIQANLEHYQNSMQQARSEQTLTMEKQQIQFQQELGELQRHISLQDKQVQESETLLNQKNIELKQLENQYQMLLQNHKDLPQLLQASSKELIIFKDRYDQQFQQLKIYENELNQKNLQLIELEVKNAVLIDQRDGIQKTLSDAKDKVEFLQQEKLFLSQEKSQLEYHFKQIEKMKVAG